MIQWDEFANSYAKAMREDFGRPVLDVRIVIIGALIIKQMNRFPQKNGHLIVKIKLPFMAVNCIGDILPRYGCFRMRL